MENVYSAVRNDCLCKADYVWSLTVVESVYRAVRTDSLYKADYVWSLNNRGGKCLQRGTDWLLIQSRLRLVFKECVGKCLQRGTD